jgi:hypothetical protein
LAILKYFILGYFWLCEAIVGYFWLLKVISPYAIIGCFMLYYHGLFVAIYWWLLLVILLVIVGNYSIGGYRWLFYW